MEVFGIGLPELLLIMVIALIVFGPGKLPELGAALGRAVGDFRRASRELTDDLQGTISEARKEIEQTKGEVQAATGAATQAEQPSTASQGTPQSTETPATPASGPAAEAAPDDADKKWLDLGMAQDNGADTE